LKLKCKTLRADCYFKPVQFLELPADSHWLQPFTIPYMETANPPFPRIPVGHCYFLPLKPHPHPIPTNNTHLTASNTIFGTRSHDSHFCTQDQWCHHHQTLPEVTCWRTYQNKSVHERPSTASHLLTSYVAIFPLPDYTEASR